MRGYLFFSGTDKIFSRVPPVFLYILAGWQVNAVEAASEMQPRLVLRHVIRSVDSTVQSTVACLPPAIPLAYHLLAPSPESSSSIIRKSNRPYSFHPPSDWHRHLSEISPSVPTCIISCCRPFDLLLPTFASLHPPFHPLTSPSRIFLSPVSQLGRVREEAMAPGVSGALNTSGLNSTAGNAAYAL